jgi:uncharacterized protein YjiS (DUF1127 family)
MAHAIRNNEVALSISARVGEIFAQAIEAYRAKNDFRRTYNELSKLSARELDDLGISRSEIRSVAMESTYGTTS